MQRIDKVWGIFGEKVVKLSAWSFMGKSLITSEGRVTVTKELRTNWFGPHFEKWALISHDCYTVQFVNTFWKCELILEAKMQFVNTFLLLQKWVQNEEQFTALFALISKLGKCIHKTVFTKLYSQKWAATVTRPSVLYANVNSPPTSFCQHHTWRSIWLLGCESAISC